MRKAEAVPRRAVAAKAAAVDVVDEPAALPALADKQDHLNPAI